MNMSDKLVFSSLKIFREFHDKTALNVIILYKVQNFHTGKMCISVFYFICLFKKKYSCYDLPRLAWKRNALVLPCTVHITLYLRMTVHFCSRFTNHCVMIQEVGIR